MKRRSMDELLDSDSCSQPEIAAALADLRFINWAFGGVSTTEEMIQRVVKQTGKRRLSLLEVAAGSGYVPRTLRGKLRPAEIELDLTLLDRAWSHLSAPENNAPQFPRIAGNALTLPFRDGSFDLVSCSLFAHHLAPQDVIRFARESLRVCRDAVLINDLIRHPLHLGLVYAGLPLFRSRITWHDAPASVRQAYTLPELQELLESAGAAKIEIRRQYLFRVGAILWKTGLKDQVDEQLQ
jgi:ubiquinone/menaquinone biosynthesis C-methylase UbiE